MRELVKLVLLEDGTTDIEYDSAVLTEANADALLYLLQLFSTVTLQLEGIVNHENKN